MLLLLDFFLSVSVWCVLPKRELADIYCCFAGLHGYLKDLPHSSQASVIGDTFVSAADSSSSQINRLQQVALGQGCEVPPQGA